MKCVSAAVRSNSKKCALQGLRDYVPSVHSQECREDFFPWEKGANVDCKPKSSFSLLQLPTTPEPTGWQLPPHRITPVHVIVAKCLPMKDL